MKGLWLTVVLMLSSAIRGEYASGVYFGKPDIDSLCSNVYGDEISGKKKFALVRKHDALSLWSDYSDSLLPLYNYLLYRAKKKECPNNQLYCYSAIADVFIGLGDKQNALLYLDSAANCISERIRETNLANYYRVKGNFTQKFQPFTVPDAVHDYQQALDYYDKTGIDGQEEAVINILLNRTIGGVRRRDLLYLSKNIQRLSDMTASYSSPSLDFSFNNSLAGKLYLHFCDTGDSLSLDSSIYYLRKALDAYDTGLIYNAIEDYATDLSVIYANLLCRKAIVNYPLVDSILTKAEKRYRETDSIGKGRICHARARLLLNVGKTDEAETMALKAFGYLSSVYRNDKFSTLPLNAMLLRDIYTLRGDYRNVIKYDDMYFNFDAEIRMKDVKESLLKYESESKQTQYTLLNDSLTYRKIRHNIYIALCVLLVLAVLLFSLNMKSRRDALTRQIALIDMEQEEIKLQLRLKEEETIKMQLEKYEALSDFHLKEAELLVKDKDLEQLYRDKAELDRQVESYRRKMEDYEQSLNTGAKSINSAKDVIVNDVISLLENKLRDSRQYTERLREMHPSGIDLLRQRCGGNLSVSYAKYCLFFAIGVDVYDIADCFDIEQTSVHMVRYRLKKKFALGNEDDLDEFLQAALFSGKLND